MLDNEMDILLKCLETYIDGKCGDINGSTYEQEHVINNVLKSFNQKITIFDDVETEEIQKKVKSKKIYFE